MVPQSGAGVTNGLGRITFTAFLPHSYFEVTLAYSLDSAPAVWRCFDFISERTSIPFGSTRMANHFLVAFPWNGLFTVNIWVGAGNEMITLFASFPFEVTGVRDDISSADALPNSHFLKEPEADLMENLQKFIERRLHADEFDDLRIRYSSSHEPLGRFIPKRLPASHSQSSSNGVAS
jgi:hypothetical protein